MINSIGLKNIRIFKNFHKFEIKPFTILTGTNNSGKSTLQKALFLIKNSIPKNTSEDIPLLGKLIFNNYVLERFGDFESVKSNNSSNNDIEFCFEIFDNLFGNIELHLTFGPFQKEILLQQISVTKDKKEILSYKIKSFLDYLKTNDFKITQEISDKYKDYYLWTYDHPNCDLNISSIYNSLLNEKLAEINQHYICEIDIKLQENKELSEFERLKRKDFENKGYCFNDSNLINERLNTDYGYASVFDEIYVWDSNNKRKYIFNYYLRESCSVYYDLNPHILIPTKLGKIVLSNANFFNDPLPDFYSVEIRNLLIENNILSIDNFIKSYYQFELLFVYYNIYNKTRQPQFFDNELDWHFAYAYECQYNYFFSTPSTAKIDNSNFITNISEFNCIAKILKSEVYKSYLNSEFKEDDKNIISDYYDERLYQHRKIIKEPKTYKEEIEILEKLGNKIQEAINMPIKSLSSSLNFYFKNIQFFNKDFKIKKFYLFNSIEEEDQTYVEFGKLYHNSKDAFKKNIDFINSWLIKFNIGQELIVKPINVNNSVIGIAYFIKINNKEISLSDNGLGINKLINILLRILSSDANSTFYLEEPEVNLHPAFQSKLADLLYDIKNSFSINFIIETHSEYLIRKFQYLVAKAQLNPIDLSLYYFYDPYNIPNNKKFIDKIEVLPNGTLNKEFGPGFFDEADNIAMQLFALKNAQKN